MNIPQNLSENRSTLYAQPLEQDLSGNLSATTNNSSLNNNYRSNTKITTTTRTAQKPTPDAYRGFKCTPTLGWLALFNVFIALIIIICALLFNNHDDKQSFFWNTPRSHSIDANPNSPKTPYIDNNNIPVAPSTRNDENGNNNNNGNRPIIIRRSMIMMMMIITAAVMMMNHNHHQVAQFFVHRFTTQSVVQMVKHLVTYVY
eukprot:UN01971